jgi:hypothetical protein
MKFVIGNDWSQRCRRSSQARWRRSEDALGPLRRGRSAKRQSAFKLVACRRNRPSTRLRPANNLAVIIRYLLGASRKSGPCTKWAKRFGRPGNTASQPLLLRDTFDTERCMVGAEKICIRRHFTHRLRQLTDAAASVWTTALAWSRVVSCPRRRLKRLSRPRTGQGNSRSLIEEGRTSRSHGVALDERRQALAVVGPAIASVAPSE